MTDSTPNKKQSVSYSYKQSKVKYGQNTAQSFSVPFCSFFLALLFFFFTFGNPFLLGNFFPHSSFTNSVAFAATAKELEKKLAKEQSKAQARKVSLQRLTDQERTINTSLADTESKILHTEKALDDLQKKLHMLAQSDTQAEAEYNTIQKRRDQTLKSQNEIMLLLWEIIGKKESIGAREMTNWAVVDREYRWSRDLLKALEAYHVELSLQKNELGQVLAKRDMLSKQVAANVQKVNKNKEQLLKLQLSYSNQLLKIRKERQTTEQELTNILKIVNNLNLAIDKTGGNIARLKGKLPWPIAGDLKKKYAPNANPAFRGIGVSSSDGKAVLAVASGKVVHNGLLRGLGTVLVLQHGEDYYSIYAYLKDSPLAVGREVKSQERIGTAGFFPDLNGPGLYFELRFGQKAINPEQWLSAR